LPDEEDGKSVDSWLLEKRAAIRPRSDFDRFSCDRGPTSDEELKDALDFKADA
jgi:hypothetical protein